MTIDQSAQNLDLFHCELTKTRLIKVNTVAEPFLRIEGSHRVTHERFQHMQNTPLVGPTLASNSQIGPA